MADSDLFQLAVTGSPCGILVCDGDGVVLFANDTVERLFGYNASELLGMPIEELVPAILRSKDVEPGAVFSSQPESYPLGVSRNVDGRRKDGTLIAIEVALMASRHHHRPVVVASVLDGTTRRALKAQLAGDHSFDSALAEIAARFVAVTPDRLDDTIVESQRRLATLLGVDRSTLWQPTDQKDDFVYTHIWLRDKTYTAPVPSQLRAGEHFPWVIAQLREGRPVAFTSVDELPSAVDRDSFRRGGLKSAACLPLMMENALIGVLAFGTDTVEHPWSAFTLDRLQLAAAVFANSLSHRRDRELLEHALSEVRRLKDQLALENVQLRREVRTLKGPRVLAADSQAARQVLAQVEQVAPTTATVLMLGETGSGKEVFAEALHDLSPRRQKPMVRVNCAAIPTALIESELFGRERGAYTGALSRQLGRFEVADGSTIFLDEVGELPSEVQVKLLRVLQDHIIERLGSPQQIKVNVRIIAATNKDLEQAVADRTFREDLYYRLNVFPIRVPPLRERVEDIPSLVWSFINEFAAAFGKNVESLSKHSLHALQAYPWPGNVRELRNVIERAMIVSNGPQLVIEPPRPSSATKRKSLKIVDMEVDHIRSVLEATGWRIRGRGGAADLLGMKPTTLESRMAKLGINRAARTNGDRSHGAENA